MRPKIRPFLFDFKQLRQREYLKSAAVGENGSVPAAEFVKSAEFGDDVFARSQRQMVRVPENHLRAGCFELADFDSLDGPDRPNRHERRGLNDSVRGMERAAPCPALRINR